MSASTPMAVQAPTFQSDPAVLAAHVPQVNKDSDDSDDDTPLGAKQNGRKRSESSSEDEKPLNKKPRASLASAAKKRRIVASDDEESDASPGPSAPKAKPAAPQSAPKSNGASKKKSRTYSSSDDSESSEDAKPLAKKANGKPKPKAKAASEVSDLSMSSSEDEKPLAKKKAIVPSKKPRSSTTKVKKELSSSEDEKPLAKKAAKPKPNGDAKSAKKVQVKKEKDVKVKKEEVKEEDEDDSYKWWEQEGNDGSVKWTHLEHNGVLFPPPYVPLPRNVKMKYDGQPLTLPPESEEVAGFFGAMLATDHAQDKTFRENFFRDFRIMLASHPPAEGTKITSFDKCDFGPMYDYYTAESEKKKAMTREEKKAIKEAKDKLEAPYLFATIDGRKEKAGNFRAEPPGLFRGRGEHPKKGTLKFRLRPEDIVINIAKDAPLPKPNVPGQWKAVQHDSTVTWLAHWKENVNGNSKYVFLAAGSAWKGQSDRAKFEKARELIKHVDKIRKDYTKDLTSKVNQERQRATALYFIDRLALRAGNEKGEDEADTVGCCSLRYEHVTLEPPNKVIFDFLGKDSMRFHQEVEVDSQVFKNIKIFKKEPKAKGDDLFDRLTTTILNKYLNDQMKGLTAKVFRTYNASWTFQQQLKNTPKNGSIQEKIAAYNTANRDVAILCNHQKTVSKGFEASFAKMGDGVRALKYQRMKLRYQLFALEPKMKKRKPELAEDETDVDDEFVERHEEELEQKAMDAARKKFDRDNQKLEEAQEAKQSKSVLDDRLKEIKAEYKELRKERKSKSVEPKKGATEEKLLEAITKMDDRIATAKVKMTDRDKTKDVALGTSKINYIDPRLTVAWAAKHNVPLEKLFSKTLREKFPWAEAEADADWVF